MKRAPVVPSLFAPDIESTIAYYVDALGFSKTGVWEDDGKTTWAEISLGSSQIWFFKNKLNNFDTPAMSGLIYVFVDDVKEMAVRLKGNVDIRWGPDDMEYGLRELGIKDNNGYIIVFAQDI